MPRLMISEKVLERYRTDVTRRAIHAVNQMGESFKQTSAAAVAFGEAISAMTTHKEEMRLMRNQGVGSEALWRTTVVDRNTGDVILTGSITAQSYEKAVIKMDLVKLSAETRVSVDHMVWSVEPVLSYDKPKDD